VTDTIPTKVAKEFFDLFSRHIPSFPALRDDSFGPECNCVRIVSFSIEKQKRNATFNPHVTLFDDRPGNSDEKMKGK
jgi:hypothetical protein